MGLKDKVCIITGGGSGIGLASALKMASEGAKVVLVGRTGSKLERAREEIEAGGGTAKTVVADVSDYEVVRRMASTVLDSFGRIDVLVNTAGINDMQLPDTLSHDEVWDRVMDVNLD